MQVQTTFLFHPTPAARDALGLRQGDAARAAFREVSLAARGFDIAHLQFEFRGLTLSVASRIRLDGHVQIEADLGNPGQPRSLFTEREFRAAERAAIARREADRKSRARRW